MNTADAFGTWTDRLAERPEIYPHQINLTNDSVLLVKLSEEEIRSASFLDQRVLNQTTQGQWVAWQPVADVFAQAEQQPVPAFIFHVGHCGSTLLSRLVEFAEQTRSFREPLPLRTLAQDVADDEDGRSFLTGPERMNRLRWLLRMWCRSGGNTVIKATSICTDLLLQIHTLEPGALALFMYNRAETHIATLLAGQNSLMDLKGFARLRVQRVQNACGLDIQLNQLSLGQLAALGWLSETTSIVRSLEACPQQVALLEFESLLKNPRERLEWSLKHLGIPISPAAVEQAVSSPVLRTYSKAPEHKYDAQTRAAILSDSRSRYRNEIRQGLAWLEQLAGQSGLVATAMKTCA